jgi:hypothetical protein
LEILQAQARKSLYFFTILWAHWAALKFKCAMMHSILLCLSPDDFTCKGETGERELVFNGLKFFENPGSRGGGD